MKQETVNIINIQKSNVSGKKYESTIYKTLWDKQKEKLKKQGWVLESQIESITVEEINDGKGENNVIVEEVKVEEVFEDETPISDKSYSEMSKKELQAVCDEMGVKYHHANKIEKLIELLEA